MPYTSEKPDLTPSAEVLRNTIPNWGVDLDPQRRPAVPKERWVKGETGAHWEFPERQPELYPRERSIEHGQLPPVFGTVCPAKGLSGVIRRYAYRFSEGRLAHWQLLLLADRVDVVESAIGAVLSGRPDNPIVEYGLAAEVKRGGLRSRFGQQRADVRRLSLELALAAGMAVAVMSVAASIRKRF